MIIESILTSIKDMLGPTEDYETFDAAIVAHINTAFMSLNQLGFPMFMITGKEETWSDFIANMEMFMAVKTYIFLKVQLVFDTPQTGPLVEAIERQIKEAEWRINTQAETKGLGLAAQPLPETMLIDYNEQVINKPKIDNKTLEGNKKHEDIGINVVTNSQISSLFK